MVPSSTPPPSWDAPVDLLYALLESAPDSVLVADQEGCIVLANRQAEQQFGYLSSELTALPFERLLAERYRPALRSYLTQPRSRLPLLACRRDGSEFPVEICLRPLPTPHEHLVGAFIREVRAHSPEEPAEQERAARLAAIRHRLARAGLSLDAVLAAVTEGALEALGDGCMVGLLLEDDKRLDLAALVHRDSTVQPHELGEELLGPSYQGGEPLYLPVVALDQENLKDVHSLLVVPLALEREQIGVIATWRDRSARSYQPEELALLEELARYAAPAIRHARLHQSAQAAIQLRDQFMAVASHDLQTPITSIKGFADLLYRRATNAGMTESDQRMVEIIRLEAGRLHRLVDLLLDFSRIQRGRFELRREELDITALLRHLVQLTAPSLDHHTLKLLGDEAPLYLEGDSLRLGQLFHNLIANAIKYSPQGGVVTIQLAPQDDQVAILVSDEGIGVPPEALVHLFQRFYRASNANEFGITGLGLGLYVAHYVVEAHGGTIQVESEPGRGTTFTVLLPMLARP